MTDMIVNTAVQSILKQPMPDQVSPKPGGDDPADVLRFQEALGQGSPEGSAVEPTLASFQCAPTVQNDATMGDKILASLKQLECSYDSMTSRLDRHLADMQQGNVDAAALLQMQRDLQAFSLEADLVSKVAGETSQDIQTMMRNQ